MALPTIFPIASTPSHIVSDAVGSQVIFLGALQDGLRGPLGKIIAPNHKSKGKPGKGGTHQHHRKRKEVLELVVEHPPFHILENSTAEQAKAFPRKTEEDIHKNINIL